MNIPAYGFVNKYIIKNICRYLDPTDIIKLKYAFVKGDGDKEEDVNLNYLTDSVYKSFRENMYKHLPFLRTAPQIKYLVMGDIVDLCLDSQLKLPEIKCCIYIHEGVEYEKMVKHIKDSKVSLDLVSLDLSIDHCKIYVINEITRVHLLSVRLPISRDNYLENDMNRLFQVDIDVKYFKSNAELSFDSINEMLSKTYSLVYESTRTSMNNAFNMAKTMRELFLTDDNRVLYKNFTDEYGFFYNKGNRFYTKQNIFHMEIFQTCGVSFRQIYGSQLNIWIIERLINLYRLNFTPSDSFITKEDLAFINFLIIQ